MLINDRLPESLIMEAKHDLSKKKDHESAAKVELVQVKKGNIKTSSHEID